MARTRQTARTAAPNAQSLPIPSSQQNSNVLPNIQQQAQPQLLEAIPQQFANLRDTNKSDDNLSDSDDESEDSVLDSDSETEGNFKNNNNIKGPRKRVTLRRDHMPLETASAAQKAIVNNGISRLNVVREILDGKTKDLLKMDMSERNRGANAKSTLIFSSQGNREPENNKPVWSSLWTDLTLKKFAEAVEKESDFKNYKLTLIGEDYITDNGVRWLCETLAPKEYSEKSEQLTMHLDLRHCRGITSNSVTIVKNLFNQQSDVKVDLLEKDAFGDMEGGDLKAKSSEHCISNVLFLTLPEVQFSAMRTIMEGKMIGSVRGVVAESKFMKLDSVNVAAAELCLSAYTAQLFSSQPDQVVMVVLNDFDRAVRHVADTLINFLSQENSRLKRVQFVKKEEEKQQKIIKSGFTRKVPDPPKVDRNPAPAASAQKEFKAAPQKKKGKSKASSLSEESSASSDKLELVAGKHGHSIQMKLQNEWVQPVNNRDAMFVSNKLLAVDQPFSEFSVAIVNCQQCTIGLMKIDPVWFTFQEQRITSFDEMTDRITISLKFQDGKLTVSGPAASGEVQTKEITLSSTVADVNKFVVSVAVRKGPMSGKTNRVEILLDNDSVHQLFTPSLAESEGSEQKAVVKGERRQQKLYGKSYGFIHCPAQASEQSFLLMKEEVDEPSLLAAGKPSPIQQLTRVAPNKRYLHQTQYRILCHRLDPKAGERLKEEVGEQLKKAAKAMEKEAERVEKLDSEASFQEQIRFGQCSAAAEQINDFVDARLNQHLSIYSTDQVQQLRNDIASCAEALAAEYQPLFFLHEPLVEEILKEVKGKRVASLECLAKVGDDVSRRLLVDTLNWMHERGSIIFIKDIDVVIFDQPWYFDLIESLPFEPPLVAGPLLPGLDDRAGVWSELELEKALKRAELDDDEAALLTRIFLNSGALMEVLPLREKASDDRLFYTNPFSTNQKHLKWPVLTAEQVKEHWSVHKVYTGLNFSAERIMPSLSSRASRTGRLVALAADGFVRSLWGVEVVVYCNPADCRLHQTAYMPQMQKKPNHNCEGNTQSLLWAVLHLFSDFAESLLQQHRIFYEVESEKDEPENQSVMCHHSWDSDNEHAFSICTLCNCCVQSGPQCKFNGIASSESGHCLCSTELRGCSSCGLCRNCVSQHWRQHSKVQPGRFAVGARHQMSASARNLDAVSAVKLLTPTEMQAATNPEVTFRVNGHNSQPKLQLLLCSPNFDGYISVYPKVKLHRADFEFDTEVQTLEWPIDVTLRLSHLPPLLDNSQSDHMNKKLQQAPPRYHASTMRHCTILQETGLVAYTHNFTVSQTSNPIGQFVGRRPMNNANDTFTIRIVNKGRSGTITIGVVPLGYSQEAQPGWYSGSVGYHGDDGGIFPGNGQAVTRTFQFASSSIENGALVKMQLKQLQQHTARYTFLIAEPGTKLFKEQYTGTMAVPEGGLYPIIGFHSPYEAVQLMDAGVWRLRDQEEAEVMPMATKAEASGESAMIDIIPESEVQCHLYQSPPQINVPVCSGVVSLLRKVDERLRIQVEMPEGVYCATSHENLDPRQLPQLLKRRGKQHTGKSLDLRPSESKETLLFVWASFNAPAGDRNMDDFYEGSVDVELKIKIDGQEEMKQKLKLVPQSLDALPSSSRGLFVEEFEGEKSFEKVPGPCDLLKVLESGIPLHRLLIPRAPLEFVCNQSALPSLWVTAPSFPTPPNNKQLQPDSCVVFEDSAQPERNGMCRVVKADESEVTLQLIRDSSIEFAAKAELPHVKLPEMRNVASLSETSLTNPELRQLRPASPVALLKDGSFNGLKHPLNPGLNSCIFTKFRSAPGLGLSFFRSLRSGSTRVASSQKQGFCVFLPDLQQKEQQLCNLLRQPCAAAAMAEVANMRAHLLCCGAVPEAHIIDSTGVVTKLDSVLHCYLTAAVAVRALSRHKLLLPLYSKLAPSAECQLLAEFGVWQLLLQSGCIAHWMSLSGAELPEVNYDELLEQISTSCVEYGGVDAKQLGTDRLIPSEKGAFLCRSHVLSSGSEKLETLFPSEGGAVDTEALQNALSPYAACLRNLRLDSDKITSISASYLSAFPNLETLTLQQVAADLQNLQLQSLLKLRSVSVLNSSTSHLPQDLGVCPNLRQLHVRAAAQLKSLPDSWTEDSRLENITLELLSLQQVPQQLGRLRHLRSLKLQQLSLLSLPPEIGSLLALEELSVEGVPWPEKIPDSTEVLQALTAPGRRPVHAADHDHTIGAGALGRAVLLSTPRLGIQAPADDEFGGIPACVFELRNLVTLRITHQAIRRLPDSVANLTRLRQLQLSHNPLLESLSSKLSNLRHFAQVDVTHCPSLKTPPIEVVQRGSGALLSYLKFLSSEQIECKRTKLMFVGLGGVGKTSLLQALQSPESRTKAVGKEEITDGIDIGNWEIRPEDNSTPLQFSTWDFAGQKVYYNTHQFFLTRRAVYLLLYTVRTGYEHAGLDFWLSSINCHAPNAPIVVVGTHADQVEKPDTIPQELYKARYPQIVSFHFVSSHTAKGIGSLRQELIDIALRQSYMDEKVPKIFLNFEDKLMEKRTAEKQNVLEWSEVEAIAQAQGLYEDKHVRQAVTFLNDIGSIQYFDTEFLRQKVVINPRWIVDVMACVVSVKNSPIKNGQMLYADIPKIWKQFDSSVHDWLLKLTEAFDLTYPMPGGDCNMVPCLLPEEEPEFTFPSNNNSQCSQARFIYQFGYLPAGLFNRAQVRLFEFTDSETMWKRGSLLQKDQHTALITMDEKQRLTISVHGPRPENVMFMISDVIDCLIDETFQGVHYETVLACPECINSDGAIEGEPSLIRVGTIRKATERQISFLQCANEFHVLNLSTLLGSIPANSSSDFDQQLEQSLVQLKRARLEMTRDVCVIFSEADFMGQYETQSLFSATIVADRLEAAGMSCYPVDISLPEDRLLQVKDCKLLLVLLSKEFAADESLCRLFLNAKNTLRKRMIFLSVGPDKGWRDNAELAYAVSDQKYIDFTFDKKMVYEEKFKELLADATAVVEAAKQTEPGLGKDVFVSYCWANSHDAVAKGTRNGVLGCEGSDPRAIRERLEEAGLRCWLDVKDAGSRGLFEGISDGLRQCSLVLAFVSDEYQRSANCMMEFRFASKILRKPIVSIIVGEKLTFKTQELGMLSCNYPEFDFRHKINPIDFDQLSALLKKQLQERKEEEAKKSKNSGKDKADKDDKKQKLQRRMTEAGTGGDTDRGMFHEEAELAQRRFLKQFGSTHMPRLLVLDFADVIEFESSEEAMPTLTLKILCESGRGWHVHGDPIELSDLSHEQRTMLLASTAAYLLRIYSLLQASGIVLNCLEGQEFMQKIRSEASSSSQTFADAHASMQSLLVGRIAEDQLPASLSKCQLGSGNILWLCTDHQANGNGRVTVLPSAGSSTGSGQQVVTEADRILKEAMDELLPKEASNEAEKYKRFSEEQQNYIKEMRQHQEAAAPKSERPRLNRHRTSALIGQKEAADTPAAAAAAARAGAGSAPRPRPRSSRKAAGTADSAAAAADTLTASQVSLKNNRSRLCVIQ